MKNSRDVLEEALETVEEEETSRASNRTKSLLADALDRVAQGHLGIPNAPIQLPTYPGFLNIWDYARDVRRALLASIDAAIKLAEDEARVTTSAGVDRVKALGEVHLPQGVERSRRVFMPEAMFSVHRRGAKGANNRRRGGSGSAIVAGGTQGLGIGLAARPELLETTFFDLFDFNQQFLIYVSPESAKYSLEFEDEDEGPSTTALSILGVGLSALTMVGGQAIGARGMIEGLLRIGEVFSNESSRRWVAPVLGVATIGLGVYLVFELPSSVPRTVGRRVRAQVLRQHRQQQLQRQQREIQHHHPNQNQIQLQANAIVTSYNNPTPTQSFTEAHAERVGRETRKVLRLASWDLRERFRGALEERTKEVKGSEELERKARKAKEWFESVMERTGIIRGEVKLEELVQT